DHEALRMLCGTVDERVVHKNGITINNRTYRSELLISHLKETVYVIIDPDNMDEVNVFDMESRAICVAQATVRTMFRHTTEEDYKRAEKEKKAVRAFNKKYQPTREYTVTELIAKQQFEELQYEQRKETEVVEQINPQVTANAKKLKETKQAKKIPKEQLISNSLFECYGNRKIGG
ncbi:MAG: Mu transposase C-terminal domain-containing protein, partial [Oscillospiraceae bacterium]